MTIEEMFRRIVRAHLSLIVVCALLPLVAAVGINLKKPPEWRAVTRIQVASTAPKSSIEADGLSSRVLALATTSSLLDSALRSAKVSRDLRDYATKHVTADRLGQSSVVQISVTDLDGAAASRIATALAGEVANFMNNAGRSRYDSALADLNKQIQQTTAQREKLAARLRRTVDLTDRSNVQADIASADQELSRLSEQRATLVLADATRDEVVVVGTITDLYEVPSELIPQSALALLLGLVIGLTAAAVLETVRPRVAGPRALARLLEAPLLGKANEPRTTLKNAMALAARRQGVETVVLMGVEERDNEAIDRLLAELKLTEATTAATQTLEAGSSASNGSTNSHTASQPTISMDLVGSPAKATTAATQTLEAGSSASNGSTNSHTASQPTISMDLVGSPAKATTAATQTLEAGSSASNGSTNSHMASQPTTPKAGLDDPWPIYPVEPAEQTSTQPEQPTEQTSTQPEQPTEQTSTQPEQPAEQTSTQPEQPAGTALNLDESAILPVGNLRFTTLLAIRPEDEITAGVVVVSSGTVLHHRLDNLDDVLKAVRWPVLGVLDAVGKRRRGGSR
jgi:capsular polysaccharide biosynthesis protein